MLIEATDQDFQTLIAGQAPAGFNLCPGNIESPAILEMLRQVALSVRPALGAVAWMIVESDEIVGLLSITRFENSAAMIGYGVATAYRGRGICTRAVSAFLNQIAPHPTITEIQAETSIHNIPSQRILEHNGFERVGERVDEEDGELYCWRFALDKSCTGEE